MFNRAGLIILCLAVLSGVGCSRAGRHAHSHLTKEQRKSAEAKAAVEKVKKDLKSVDGVVFDDLSRFENSDKIKALTVQFRFDESGVERFELRLTPVDGAPGGSDERVESGAVTVNQTDLLGSLSLADDVSGDLLWSTDDGSKSETNTPHVTCLRMKIGEKAAVTQGLEIVKPITVCIKGK